MTQPTRYATATAFRQALEARLMNLARTEHVDIQRLRRQVAFDRLLCRLFHDPKAPWSLKGGYAMELRLAMARTTRDIDLSVRQRITGGKKALNSKLLDMLQAAAGVELGDFFIFLMGEPIMDLDAAPYGGGRFPVEARVDGRTFAKFHIDVGVGDIVIKPMEAIHGRDWLDFAGLAATDFQAISCEQQFAEKFHTFTLPRQGAENSRVRDLVDMLLLIHKGGLSRSRTLDALRRTFAHRATHPLPQEVPLPPASWEQPFVALATVCGLKEDLGKAHASLCKFMASPTQRKAPSHKTKARKA
jgi:hypothetical protein